MLKRKESKEYVETELPYRLFIEIYKNSRRSLKELGRSLHISYHTISKTLKRLEDKYNIVYALELDTNKLGFSEGRIITIKFEERPDLDYLKQRFQKDIFVQEAYLAEGDFDLLFYVVGLTSKDFMTWQWKLRSELRKYKPTLKISTVNSYTLGFFPIRNELLSISEVISNADKKILEVLNDNSRVKLKELVLKTKITQMRVIYALKKFKETGIIQRFAALTQKPDKRIFLAYGMYVSPGENHPKLEFDFLNELIKEDEHEITSDYSLILDAVGTYDSFYICSFENGEQLSRRGPDLQKNLLNEESPRIDRAVLTGILVGKWPFHLDDYDYYKMLVKKDRSRSESG
ncbi:MAG: winged helix-turn-helix transcriptional regulator [Candidatus Micrarchaeales archaeon]|jgi:DNA-binding Lrp family transcriptional regulator